jgi:hypothetical protein
MSIPPEFGAYRWYGNTRFTGPRVARQFFLAPAGRHRVIPRKILPGGRQLRRSFRGYDVLLFEAVDRSDAAVVWVGPFNEATTWFGGPGPDEARLHYLAGTAELRDSAAGASLSPTSEFVRGSDTSVIGMNRASRLIVRSATDALPLLPGWAGLTVPGGEIWRTERALEPADARAVAGTPHRYRYLVAGPTAVLDLVLLGPESGRERTSLGEGELLDALRTLTASWAG